MRLFIKIFFTFYAALFFLNIIIISVTLATQPDAFVTPFMGTWRSLVISALNQQAQQAVLTWEQQGQMELARYLEAETLKNKTKSYLFTAQGQELSSGSSPEVKHFLQELTPKNEPQFKFLLAKALVATAVHTDKGNYCVIAVLPVNRLDSSILTPRTRLLRNMVVISIIGLTCYLLTTYLTRPIIKLRNATQQITQGNLATRVVAKVLRRRDEIGRLGQDFNLMAAQIEQLVSAQKQLLSDISHELRSPLARLTVALELARERAGESAQTALDRIEQDIKRLNQLIGELLTLSHLESGLAKANRQLIDLVPLLNQIITDANFEATQTQKEVVATMPPQLLFNGDQELLYRAFENIIRNALRYTPENSQVTVNVTQSPNEIVVQIIDQGKGLPPEELTNIFRPFYRVANARDRKSGGVGLGLAITARAIELHKGHISATNTNERGLQIEIQLPSSSYAKVENLRSEESST